jgi:hemoglobin
MVVEYIRYTIPQPQHDELESSPVRVLAGSEHCHSWKLSRGVEESEHYILRSEWDSVEGHEPSFRKSPDFRDFVAAFGGDVSNVQEMRHSAPTQGGGR